MTGSGAVVNISGGEIADNKAYNHGGAIMMQDGKLNISGGTISGNKTEMYHGAAIYMSKGTATMTGGKICGNEAAGAAGAIMHQGGTFTLSGGEISGNKAGTAGGGAVYIGNAAASFVLKGEAVVSGNTSTYGGFYVTSGGKLTVEGGKLSDNTADRGGAIFGDNITISGGTFTDNRANAWGGVLWYAGSRPVHVSGGTFTGNTAGDNGPVFYSNGSASLPEFRISGGTYTENFSEKTGEVVLLSAHTVIMTGGTFTGNTMPDGKPLRFRLHNYQGATQATFSGTAVVEDGGIECSPASATADAATATVSQLRAGARLLSIKAMRMDAADYTIASSMAGSLSEYTYNPEIPSEHATNWTKLGGETEVVPYEDWAAAGPYYALSVALAAKEMTEDVTVQIFGADDQPVSEEYTDSVRAYVERNYEGSNDETKTLMVDMLNYGAAAQEYFGYKTEDLANAGLTEEQQAMASEEVECADGRVTGENYMGSRLVLESRISLQLAFKNVDESCYAVYTYTDHYGEEKSVTVDGADFIGGYGVELGELVLADAKQLVTCTVYNESDEAVASVTDSVESYIARATEENILHGAIMKFAASAYAYFH